MSWRLEFRPEVELDVASAVAWYDSRESGLGRDFVTEIIRVWDELTKNPLLNSRRHPKLHLRWRFPERFPYRIIYEVDEAAQSVLVIAVLHAARHDRHWQSRL